MGRAQTASAQPWSWSRCEALSVCVDVLCISSRSSSWPYFVAVAVIMVNSAVYWCSNRSWCKNSENRNRVKFYGVPLAIYNQSNRTQELRKGVVPCGLPHSSLSHQQKLDQLQSAHESEPLEVVPAISELLPTMRSNRRRVEHLQHDIAFIEALYASLPQRMERNGTFVRCFMLSRTLSRRFMVKLEEY